jgi:hypothetical protein
MTTTFNALAAGLIGAAALIGGTQANPIPPVTPNNDQAGAVATPASTAQAPDRIYCYSGVTGTPTSQARGWVCQREWVPENGQAATRP